MLLKKKILMGAMAFLVGVNTSVFAVDKVKVTQSIASANEFLIKTQNPDGSWGEFPHPAIAALCAISLHKSPGIDESKSKAAVDKALDYVLQYRQPDGAIFPKAKHEENKRSSAYYPNYTTSTALLALATVNRAQDLDAIKGARAFIKANQFNDPAKVDFGGMGYGKTGRADLSNSSWAAEALLVSEFVDAGNEKSEASDKKMWADLATFLTKCQNLPETNTEDYVSKEAKERGGFFYRPNESKAGEESEGAQTKLLSSGSMTYAGLKSMLYAKVDKDDIRVKAAMEYSLTNYTLDENPGMGQQGLYYYLMVMTKSFEAYNEDELTLKDGKKVIWRDEVSEKIISLQREDGRFENDNARFMETLPFLVTPYSVISLRKVIKE